MIALGVTRADAPLPPPCQADRTGAFSLVLAPETAAGQARARLGLQLACHRARPAFLPFPARHAISIAAARRWMGQQGPDLGAALVAIEDRTQLTLHCNRRAPEPPQAKTGGETGTGWLRRRAQETRMRDDLAAALRAHCERLPRQPHALQDRAMGLALHLLVPTDEFKAQIAAWRAVLADLETTPWQMVLSGGWPPMAFGPPPPIPGRPAGQGDQGDQGEMS